MLAEDKGTLEVPCYVYVEFTSEPQGKINFPLEQKYFFVYITWCYHSVVSCAWAGREFDAL